ncbi:hypothetical protein [Nostoc sp.]|uniref:hypothetical protein n=1 Tax=Nostoc sp. TaxID=1180 RepID=UPI002FF7AEBF
MYEQVLLEDIFAPQRLTVCVAPWSKHPHHCFYAPARKHPNHMRSDRGYELTAR